MHDIVFDFSASPVGGGLRRIAAFTRYFAGSNLRTLFLVQPAVARVLDFSGRADIKVASVDLTSRILGRSAYLHELDERPEWLFSYGIPLHAPIGRKNWFHVSNALPLCLGHVTLTPDLYLRMALLRTWIKVRAMRSDVVSAESRFALERHGEVAGSAARAVLLNNGVSSVLLEAAEHRRGGDHYAVAVGTASYKRIDRTYTAYTALRRQYGFTRLVIVGRADQVPRSVRTSEDVMMASTLPDREYYDLLGGAEAFISTSEVENSSLAVIEGLLLSRRCLLSDIPSHREMLLPELVARRVVGGCQMLMADAPCINWGNAPSWEKSIQVMLAAMGFS